MRFTQIVVQKSLFLALPAILPLSQAASQSITFDGADTSTGADWRDASVAKANDDDNVYGTDGYFLFNIGGGFNGDAFWNAVDSTPSYLNVTNNGGNFSVGGFADLSDINDPTNPSVNIDSGSIGIAFGAVPSQGAEVSLFDINFTAGTPTAPIRIGVLANNSDGENPSAMRLELVGSPTITASATITPDNGANSPAEWFFFNLSGVSAGDTFTLFATDALGGNQEIKGIGGITIDFVPEPTSAGLLLGLAAASLLLRRRA